MLPHQQTRPNKSRKLENLAILLLQEHPVKCGFYSIILDAK